MADQIKSCHPINFIQLCGLQMNNVLNEKISSAYWEGLNFSLDNLYKVSMNIKGKARDKPLLERFYKIVLLLPLFATFNKKNGRGGL